MAVIGLLVIAGYLFLRSSLKTEKAPKKIADNELEAAIDLRPLFIARLNEIINKGSDGLYQFTTEDLKVDVLAGTVIFIKPKLVPDFSLLPELEKKHKAPDDVFTISLDSLSINGLDLQDVLSKKNIDLDELLLIHPAIKVVHQKRKNQKIQGNDTATLYKRIMGQMKHIAVKKIIIKEGTLENKNLTKNKISKLTGLSVLLNDLLLDSSTQKGRDRFLFSKSATISFKDYATTTGNKRYRVGMDEVTINGTQNSLQIKNLALIPQESKEAFSQKVKTRTERYSIKIPSLQLKNIAWWDLMNEEEMKADEAIIAHCTIEVYLDRSLPPSSKSKIGSYPHQLLMALPLPVDVRVVTIKNSDIVYEEFNPASGKTGKLFLNDFSARATNITNMPNEIKKNRFAKIEATALVKHSIPLKANLTFDLAQYKSGKFSASVAIGGTNNLQILNDLAEPLGMVSLKTGTITSLTSTLDGNNTKASGKVVLQYQNLHIRILKKDEGEPGGFRKKTIISKLANAFVIKDNNPSPGNEVRKEDAFFKRDIHGSFFNLIWKTTRVGILKTIGAPAKLANPPGS